MFLEEGSCVHEGLFWLTLFLFYKQPLNKKKKIMFFFSFSQSLSSLLVTYH